MHYPSVLFTFSFLFLFAMPFMTWTLLKFYILPRPFSSSTSIDATLSSAASRRQPIHACQLPLPGLALPLPRASSVSSSSSSSFFLFLYYPSFLLPFSRVATAHPAHYHGAGTCELGIDIARRILGALRGILSKRGPEPSWWPVPSFQG